ncbi:MAG: glycosyltransferase family 2 protein [Bifidobacterium castoris]|nr:glycosyltransferase family 2 protein [Bifidobacterium castoris]
MPTFGFVVLHYLVDDATTQCVESIRKYCAGGDYHVVVVDNNSANGSYERLRERYAGAGDVTLLHNAANEGFARGNNKGYEYCCTQLGCDYIVTLNNDVVLADDGLMRWAVADYTATGCAVIGPDIISGKDGDHQNPMSAVVDSPQQIHALRKHIRRNMLLLRTHLYGVFKQLKGDAGCGRTPDNAASFAREHAAQRPCVPVKLHGSCLIFTPAFLKAFTEPFDPGTFLYMEEDILVLRCRRQGLTLYYDPRIVVHHAEDVSTEAQVNYDPRRKQINYLRYHRDSLRVVEHYV